MDTNFYLFQEVKHSLSIQTFWKSRSMWSINHSNSLHIHSKKISIGCCIHYQSETSVQWLVTSVFQWLIWILDVSAWHFPNHSTCVWKKKITINFSWQIFNTFNLDKYLNNKSKNRDKRMFVYISVRNSQMRKGHGICLPYRPLNPSWIFMGTCLFPMWHSRPIFLVRSCYKVAEQVFTQ